MLRIYLLGNLKIFDGDTALPRPSPDKVLLLWGYLLLKGRHPVSRNYLAYLLWPDVSESEARANLRRHLHLLRKYLPASPPDTPWILSARQTIQWNPEANYWLDVAALEAFDAAKANEEDWATLIETCRGDLLTEFYDDWILTERAQLHQRYSWLLERRIAAQKEAGDLSGAIYTTKRLLTADPLREEPYRELMELYYRAGDRAAALREFEKCRAMLQGELNAEPMPETLALRNAILNGERRRSAESDSAPLPPDENDKSKLESARQLPDESAAGKQPSSLLVSVRRNYALWIATAVLLGLLLAAFLWATGLPSFDAALPLSTLSLSGPKVTQDTWIDKDNPTLLYDPEDPDKMLKADYEQVHLMFWGFPYDRVLIRFDLSQLPAGAEIKKAVFYQHLDNYTNKDLSAPLPATISAFRILRPWQAQSATFNAPWSQPGLLAGVDYDSQPLSSRSFHGATWFAVDVTALAQDWAAHPERNFGLMLMLTDAPQGAHYWVDTSEHHLTDRRPRLEITY